MRSGGVKSGERNKAGLCHGTWWTAAHRAHAAVGGGDWRMDTDNILVVTAASLTSSSISRTSLNKICEIGLHHSEAAPTFYPPALACWYSSRMPFFPLAPCWPSCSSTHTPLEAKTFCRLFPAFLLRNFKRKPFGNVTCGWRGMDVALFMLLTCWCLQRHDFTLLLWLKPQSHVDTCNSFLPLLMTRSHFLKNQFLKQTCGML